MNIEAVKSALISLAIRGKLVPQRDDEPAVEQIGEAPKEAPFELPEKWKWQKISDIAFVKGGKRIPAGRKLSDEDTGHKYLRVTNLKDASVDGTEIKYVPIDVFENIKRYVISKNDVYITVAGTIGRVGLIPACFDGANLTENADKIVIKSNLVITKEWLFRCLSSNSAQDQIKQCITKVGQPKLAIKRIENLLIPLPPLAEQRRIVAKLEELLEPLSRVQERLGSLTHDFPEQFKAAVLQKAIQGKLVPQRDDEPAVEQIGEAPKEAPFEIPAKWKWVTLSTVGKIVGGGTPKTQIPEYWVDGNIPWITPADLGKVKSKFIAAGAKCITDLGLKKSAAQLMPAGTVLFSSRAPIGHIAIARQNCCTNQGCKSLVPNTALISSDWGYYVMKTFTPDMINRATGTTFKEISGKGVAATVIPLPPLAEQRRIVEKVEQLFSQVDELTARLSS